MVQPRIYVVLVNWKGWRDTLMCLESLLRSDYPDFRVVVCDNDSGDGSVERIVDWANGSLAADTPPAGLDDLTTPALPKPIACRVCDRTTAETGGQPDDPQLLVIQTGGNLGFAGGNNVGIRYAQARSDFDYIWLLNNDTVVEKQALSELFTKAVADRSYGIIGSTLLFMEQPKIVQALGGAGYKKITGHGFPLASGSTSNIKISENEIEKDMAYVVGASMFVSKDFINSTGLMQEDYFLYFEELDWAKRMQSQFRLGYAKQSIVYHRVGGSTESLVSSFFAYRNLLRFTKRFQRKWYWVQYAYLFYMFLKATFKQEDKKAIALRNVLLGSIPTEILKMPIGKIFSKKNHEGVE